MMHYLVLKKVKIEKQFQNKIGIWNYKDLEKCYGGVLCHAAIVSREYGIPAIVSTTNIMKEIKDGETITINGTTGIIRKER